MSVSRARFGTLALARTALVAGAVTVVLAGCAPQSSGTSTPASSAASSGGSSASSPAAAGLSGDCAKDKLALKTAGKLTVGTDKPAFEPYFKNDDPSNGQGFESAVAYAVAGKLGFAKSEVTWVTAGFNAATAPGPKNFDFDINQVSITPERRAGIDFSSGYFDVTQSVVTLKGSKAAGAKSLADLASVKFGAQVGTTSFAAIKNVIKPTTTTAVFNSNDDAKLALTNGQIDAMVVDLPTGIFFAAAGTKDGGLDNAVLVGQVIDPTATKEQFGLVLDKGSKLTACATQAVDALRADGTLQQLTDQWITKGAGAPVLS